MIERLALPSRCLMRRARAADVWAIQQLLLDFDRTSSAASQRWFWQYGLIGALGAAIAAGLYLSLGGSIDPDAVVQLLIQLLGALAIALAVALGSLFVTQDWSNYWVIECSGRLVACAKLSQFHSHALLHNVVVKVGWRHRGYGSYLVWQVAQLAKKPLYLSCLPKVAEFYANLGFVPVSPQRLPPLLRYDLGLYTRTDVIPMVLDVNQNREVS